MGKKCLKCGYERQEGDVAPDYACPKCGAVYFKVEAALERQQEEADRNRKKDQEEEARLRYDRRVASSGGTPLKKPTHTPQEPQRYPGHQTRRVPGKSASVNATPPASTETASVSPPAPPPNPVGDSLDKKPWEGSGRAVALIFVGLLAFILIAFGINPFAGFSEARREAAEKRAQADRVANQMRLYGQQLLEAIDKNEAVFTDVSIRGAPSIDAVTTYFSNYPEPPVASKYPCSELRFWAYIFLTEKGFYYKGYESVAQFSDTRETFRAHLRACEQFVGKQTLVGRHLLF